MSPMRKRMIRELELHRKSPGTIKAYVGAVAQLARHYERSPERITLEEVRDFLHHLIVGRKLAFNTCNQKLAGIRFFYRHVLGQKTFDLRVPAKRSGKLPQPLGRREVAQLLQALGNAKHRVLLMTCYATGLRVSELVHLRGEDIHSQRMLNQRALLKLLFDAAAQTLLEFGRGELGGKIGFTLVLHTWDQQLRPHFHVHGLIASGALSADGSQWIAGGSRFLFPVRGLSKMFRGKYLDALANLLAGRRLDLPPQLAELDDPAGRRRWLRNLRRKPWVIYSKPPFAGPRKLLDYLGRYAHRVAISNHRILDCRDDQVRFHYHDRRDGDRRKVARLPAEEFLRRFLAHVLPDGFMRIRHYGLLANRGKRERLDHVRRLLGRPEPTAADRPQTAADWMQLLLGIDIDRCPTCGEALHRDSLPPMVLPLLASIQLPWSTDTPARGPPARHATSSRASP